MCEQNAGTERYFRFQAQQRWISKVTRSNAVEFCPVSPETIFVDLCDSSQSPVKLFWYLPRDSYFLECCIDHFEYFAACDFLFSLALAGFFIAILFVSTVEKCGL